MSHPGAKYPGLFIMKKYWKWIVGILGGIAAVVMTFFSGGIFVLCLSGACIPIAMTFWGIIVGIGTVISVFYKLLLRKVKTLWKSLFRS